MEDQKNRARSAWKAVEETDADNLWYDLSKKIGKIEFTGYNTLSETSEIVAIIDSDKEVDSVSVGNGEFYLVISPSPFYAESGGQVGDCGTLETPSARIRVKEVLNLTKNLPVLRCEVIDGTAEIHDRVTAQVQKYHRLATARNHTATHLLHNALRTVLGDHVKQSGSLVSSDRLRFDFTHYAGLSHEDIRLIEEQVNHAILENILVETELTSLDNALNAGVTALFGEKYDDDVRVVSIGEVSSELCGGTHVGATGEIGMFKIISESSISAGVRRIEAITGMNSYSKTVQWERLISDLADSLKAPADSLKERISKLQTQLKDKLKENDALQGVIARQEIEAKLDSPQQVNGINTLIHHIPGLSTSQLRDLSDQAKQRLKSGVVVLASTVNGKVMLLVSVTKDLTSSLHAGKIVGQVATIVGGGGGGRPDMAQAGGTKPEKLDEAFSAVPDIIKASL